MKRIHALIIALAIAVAAVAGTFAALRSTQLSSTPSVPAAQIAKQNRALDRAEAALRAQARQKPPALPALPVATPPSAAPQAQTVVYRRPAAIVRVVPRSGEHEGDEHESEHGDGDHGEGLDD